MERQSVNNEAMLLVVCLIGFMWFLTEISGDDDL
jgi:hypothetical protein